MTEPVLIRWLAILAVSLSLGGCAGTARVPEDSFYRLDIAAPAMRASKPALAGVLAVQGGTVAPIYRDRALLYTEQGSSVRIQRYHYQYWIDTPPQLIQRSLADYLRAAGVATRVVLPEEGGDARYRLRVDIERFEHVRGPGNGKVDVLLRLSLVDRDNGAVRVQDSVSAEAAIRDDDFTSVADAFERALEDAYGQIVMQLNRLP